MLDKHIPKYENLLFGDFNSEINEPATKEFCETYNLKNLIDGPSCFKNPLNPSSLDLILTNKYRCFQNSQSIETSLSDHHNMVITVMKSYFPKLAPILIKYLCFKYFDCTAFRADLYNGVIADYEKFQSTFMETLNKHAHMKEKYQG